jgi:tRNA pseudouridine38-40 synthase
MNRYFVELAYKGTHYHGWQIQPGATTIQEVLNKSLSTLLREDIYTIGAGRTDAGVHASKFFAHFDSVSDKLHLDEKLIYKLNSILPPDIGVFNVFLMKAGAHARFDAISRTYHYRVCEHKNPFNREFAMHLYRPLDIDLMNQSAQMLMEFTDFTSFSKLHTDTKTNNCLISHAAWQQCGEELVFTISADRFLRNMVRAIVGTLLDVGLNKMKPEEIRQIIARKNRCAAGTSVDACGLHLIDIGYPSEIFMHIADS